MSIGRIIARCSSIMLFVLLSISCHTITFEPDLWPIKEDKVSICYLGTASFLLQSGSYRILMDPGMLLIPELTSRRAAQLPNVDLVLITHDDFDHCNRLRSVPGIENTPIFATNAIKKKFADLDVSTGPIYIRDWVTVRKIKAIHGFRHAVEHTGFEIQTGGKTIYHLGDGFKVYENIQEQADLLLVTIGGSEANIPNALKMVERFNPKVVIPMHWNLLFNRNKKALDFKELVEKGNPEIQCLIPGLFVHILLD